MRVAQVGALVTTIASLSSLTYGYTFSESNKAIKAESEMTKSLTDNEKSSIYGGEEADISKYPFIASLSDSFSGSTFCAGTLITPRFILTAGHCVTLGILPTIATFESNLSSVGEAKVGKEEGVDYKIVAGFRHPLYNKTAHLYDVGLLKLEKPVKRPTAKLCASDGSDNPVGTMATAIGWGKTPDNNATMNPYLKEITLPIIANAECNKFKRYVGRITEGMLCAGVGDGKDTCNGDSGGPLIVNGDTLIGFVSWGSKCGEQASVFTRLTYVMDYIEGILNGGKGSKYGEVEPGSEMMQSIVDAMAAGSGSAQAPTNTSIPMESGSGSIDMGALLTELLNAGSSPSDLSKMFSGMNLPGSDSDSGSEDTDPEKETEDEEGSSEESSKKADSESEDAVSEEDSESADDEREAVKSGREEVMQSISDAGSADSQDVTETIDASDSGSNDTSAMLADLFGGGSNPSDLSKMFSGMNLPGSDSDSGSEDTDPEKETEDEEGSSEESSKKADSGSEDAVSEEGSESADDKQEAVKSADDEQEAVKSGREEVMQSISDAGSADSQDVTETIDASDSGSNDTSAMLADLFGGGSNPSDLSKMFSGMNLPGSDSDSGSEDTDPEKETEDEEGSSEESSKKADSESEDAVSEEGSESADDEREAVKSGREEVMQSISNAGSADSQDVTETIDASDSGSNDTSAMLADLFGGGSNPSDLSKMFSGMNLPGSDSDSGSEDTDPEKETEDEEGSSEESSKKADSGSEDAVSEEGSESADDEQEAVKSADDEQEAVKSGREEVMQSISDAGSADSQDVTETIDASDSGSNDTSAMLADLFGGGSNPSDLSKMFSGMNLPGSDSDSGSEDTDPEKETEDEEGSSEESSKKADSESEDAVSEQDSEPADDEQEAVKSGREEVMQSISDAGSADSQDVTETIDASDSGSNDTSAMLADLFGGGSNPSDLSKMFSGMNLPGSDSDSGSEDTDPEKETEDEEGSSEESLKKADSESEDAVSEQDSEPADDEQEAVKSGREEVMQSISDAGSADSQDVTETIDASDSGSNDISAILADLFGGGSNPSDLSKMFSGVGMQLPGSEDTKPVKGPEETEDSFEASLKKPKRESEVAVSEQDSEPADDEQEAVKSGREEVMQSISDAGGTDSQDVTETIDASDSGSNDISAILADLFGGGSNPSDLSKMFSGVGMQLPGSEDTKPVKGPEETEDSFEASLKKPKRESEVAVSEQDSEPADDEQKAVKSGREKVMQSISDAGGTDSQDVTETIDASDSGSNDISAILADLFGGGSNPSDLSKMFSGVGMQLPGSEDTKPVKGPEETEDSFEASLKKPKRESEVAVSEQDSEPADDEQEAVKSGREEVMQSISDAGGTDSQDVTETIDASDSGSNDINAILADLFGGGSNPSDLSKMFSGVGMQLPGSEDTKPVKGPEETEDSFEASLKKPKRESEVAVSEQDSEPADDEQEAVKSGRQDSLTYLDSGTDEKLLVKPRKSSKTMESLDEASALDEEETAEQTEMARKSDMQGGAK